MHSKTLLTSSVFATSTGSGSYDGNAAATYADQHATNRNSSYYSYLSDCANFVSQALKAGGWPYANPTLPLNDYFAWYYDTDGTNWTTWDDSNTNTWSVAKMLYSFIVLDSSPARGEYVATHSGTSSTPYPANVGKGDLFFYDWDGDAVINHTAIYAADGTDPNSGNIGALVDQHTNDRKHAIWSLAPYNSDRNTTNIYAVHLYDNF